MPNDVISPNDIQGAAAAPPTQPPTLTLSPWGYYTTSRAPDVISPDQIAPAADVVSPNDVALDAVQTTGQRSSQAIAMAEQGEASIPPNQLSQHNMAVFNALGANPFERLWHQLPQIGEAYWDMADKASSYLTKTLPQTVSDIKSGLGMMAKQPPGQTLAEVNEEAARLAKTLQVKPQDIPVALTTGAAEIPPFLADVVALGGVGLSGLTDPRLVSAIHNSLLTPLGFERHEVTPAEMEEYKKSQADINAMAQYLHERVAATNKQLETTTGANVQNPIYSTIKQLPFWAMPISPEITGPAKIDAMLTRMAQSRISGAKMLLATKAPYIAGTAASGALEAGLHAAGAQPILQAMSALGIPTVAHFTRGMIDSTIEKMAGMPMDELLSNLRLARESESGAAYLEALNERMTNEINRLGDHVGVLTSELSPADRSKLDLTNAEGNFVFTEKDPGTPSAVKQIRAAQAQIDALKAQKDAVTNQGLAHQLANQATRYFANTALQTGLSTAIGGAISGIEAPPGQTGYGIAGGSAFGLGMGGPLSLYGAYAGMHANRIGYNNHQLFAMGNKNFMPEWGPNVSTGWKNWTTMMNGLARGLGREIYVLRGDNYLNAEATLSGRPQPAAVAEGVAAPPAPEPTNGFVGTDGNLYINGDKVPEGVAGHEVTHLTQFMGQLVRESSPELMTKFEEAYNKALGVKPGEPGYVTGTDLLKEKDAEVGRILLENVPLGLFYGGETPADKMAKVARGLVNFLLPDKEKVDPLLQAPFTRRDLARMRERIFQIGEQAKRARYERFGGEQPPVAGEAPPEPPVVPPTPKPPPGPQGPPVQHPDYEDIRIRAQAAMREKLAGSKAKDVEQRIENAGIVAAAQAHAKAVGPDSDLITWRKDKYGKTWIGGQRMEPYNPDGSVKDPFHVMLLDRWGKNPDYTPEAAQNLNDIEANMGRAIAIDYSHAPEEGEAVTQPEREAARAAATAPQRVAGEVAREKLTKSYVPTAVTYYPKANAFVVNGFSPDKFLNNANIVIDWANKNGVPTYRGVNDPLLVEHMQQLTDNHNNGFTGEGKPIKGTGLTPVEQTPGYKPHVIPRDYLDQLNVMMGNDTAKTGVKGLSPEQAEKQALAKQNSPYFDPTTGETNRFRQALGKEGAKLEPVYETLRPELIDRVRQEPVIDEQTLRPTGFTGDRAQLGLRGLPRQEFVAAGFMPPTEPVRGAYQPTEEEIRAGRARGIIGAPGLWDKAQTSGQADELAKELGVDPRKRFYEQKPAAQQKITDHFRSIGQAQFMPPTTGFDPNYVQPPPMSDDELRAALSTNKVPFVGAHRDLAPGTPVSVRIDIPSFLRSGKYAQTVHAPKIGKNLGYDSIVHLDAPVSFTVREGLAEKIKARQANKAPIAAVEGKYNPDRTLPADINDLSKWTPLGFDPFEHSYFYDKTTDEPVVGGSEAIHIGNSVYVKDPVYGQREQFRYMPATGLYTKSGRAIDQKMKGPMDAEQIKAMLRNSGISPNEMEWMGLNDLKGKYSVEDMRRYMALNTPQISQMTLGGRERNLSPDMQAYLREGDTRPQSAREWQHVANYLNYLADRYREQAVQLPLFGEPPEMPEEMDIPPAERAAQVVRYRRLADEAVGQMQRLAMTEERPPAYARYTLPGGENYREVLFHYDPEQAAGYTSPHWGGQRSRNLFGHLRIDDRVTAGGNKMTFGEEMQSDWAQAIREKGVIGEVDPKSLDLAEGQFVWSFTNPQTGEAFQVSKRNDPYRSSYGKPIAQNETEARQIAAKFFGLQGMPDMPFKGAAWKKFLMRQLIKTGIEDGSDSIGWTTGQQQNERYDLAKHVSLLDWTKNDDGTYNIAAQLKNGGSMQVGTYIPADKVAGHVGREIAEKITNPPPRPMTVGDLERLPPKERGEAFAMIREASGMGREHYLKTLQEIDKKYGVSPLSGTVKGIDLTIGGEGMKGFYDKEMVNIANDIGKKFGAKVRDAQITTGPDEWVLQGKPIGGEVWTNHGTTTDERLLEETLADRRDAYPHFEWRWTKITGPETVHELPITPEMRSSVQEQGMPMWMPSTNPDAIDRGALRDKRTGEIFTSKINRYATHFMIPAEHGDRLEDYLGPDGWKNYEEGFVNNKGEFRDRDQGRADMIKHGQLEPGYQGEYADANVTDLRRAKYMPATHAAPALRLPDGEIIPAREDEFSHGQIYDRLLEEKHPNVISKTDPDVEDGWIVNRKFLTRDQASQLLGYHADTATAQFMPSTHPDAVREAAIAMPDGEIFTGAFHGFAIDAAERSGRYQPDDMDFAVAGYVDNSGNFLTRRQGLKRALDLGQITREAYNAGLERGRLDPKEWARYGLEAGAFEGTRRFMPATTRIPPELRQKAWDEVARYLTPEQLGRVAERFRDSVIEPYLHLDSDFGRSLLYAQKGAMGRKWYNDFVNSIHDIFGSDHPEYSTDPQRFAALMAALSANRSVPEDVEHSLMAWALWEAQGRPKDRASIDDIVHATVPADVAGTEKVRKSLPAWLNNVSRALTAEDPTAMRLSGPKVHAFYLNLIGDVNAVTVDRHMGIFGFGTPTMGSRPRKIGGEKYGIESFKNLAMQAHIRKVANVMTRISGETWTPAEVQAAIWTYQLPVQDLADKMGVTVQEFLAGGRDVPKELMEATPTARLLQSERSQATIKRLQGLREANIRAAREARAGAAGGAGGEGETISRETGGNGPRRGETPFRLGGIAKQPFRAGGIVKPLAGLRRVA